MSGPSYEWDILLSAFPSPPPQNTGRAVAVGRDIAYDDRTGKLILGANGDLTLRTGLDAIAQMVDLTLKTFLGEWFADTTIGVPFFQEILVKAPNIPVINQIFKSAIEAVDGIGSVTGLTTNFDRANRVLNVSWTANSNTGAPLSGSVAQPVGA